MDKFESNIYRDELAEKIKSSSREIRKDILNQAKNTDEYMYAFLEYNRPRWTRSQEIIAEKFKEEAPKLEFNLDDFEDLKNKLLILANYIYGTLTNRFGKYDPYNGDMLCEEITDRFVSILQLNGIESKKISRIYRIKDSEGNYHDNNFGHVYLIIEHGDNNVFVDPTYLQFVDKEIRQNLSPVLVIGYKDNEDFREKFMNVPIKDKIILPFYLGFNSDVAKEFFKNSKYTVESDEVARIDD